jgi:hypothetical protein
LILLNCIFYYNKEPAPSCPSISSAMQMDVDISDKLLWANPAF